jgi:hypothetical protein
MTQHHLAPRLRSATSILVTALALLPLALQAAYSLPDVGSVDGANVNESNITNIIYVDTQNANASDNNTGKSTSTPVKTIAKAIAIARTDLDNAIKTKIVIKAGVYREGSLSLNPDTANRKSTPLVIEGDTNNGTIISGADVWSGSGWTDLGSGLWMKDWTQNFGFTTRYYYGEETGERTAIAQRREVVFVDRKPLVQRMIERHSYSGANVWDLLGYANPATTLAVGEFGITEIDSSTDPDFATPTDRQNKIFVKLASGVNPNTSNHLIEVGMRAVGLGLGEKSNVVLRDLRFEHFANADSSNKVADYAIYIPIINSSHVANVFIDRCTVSDCNAAGVSLYGINGLTIRDCVFTRNGYNGLSAHYLTDTVIEDTATDFNNWRGHYRNSNLGSWYMAGAKIHNSNRVIVRRHQAIGNMAPGLWFDIQNENIDISEYVGALNSHNFFAEISNGPFRLHKSLLVNAAGNSVQDIVCGKMRVENCIFYGNITDAALVCSEWYPRDSDHARQKTLIPDEHQYRNNLYQCGSNQACLVDDYVWRAGNDYEGIRINDRYDYDGSGNRYFHPSGQSALAYSFKELNNSELSLPHSASSPTLSWTNLSGTRYAPDGTYEQSAAWGDCKFKNPTNYDFSFAADSPVSNQANYLARAIDSEAISEAFANFDRADWTYHQQVRPPSNLLLNPGFEGADLSMWTYSDIINDATKARSGSKCARRTRTSTGYSGCYQTITAQPNTSYTLTAWVKTELRSGTASAFFKQLNSAGRDSGPMSYGSSLSGVNGYTKLTATITTAASCATLRANVQLNNGIGTIWFDDLELKKN